MRTLHYRMRAPFACSRSVGSNALVNIQRGRTEWQKCYINMTTVPRPNHGEFAPFYSAYVARIRTEVDSIQQLVSQRDAVVDLLAAVADTQAAFRYAPDKWSIKE